MFYCRTGHELYEFRELLQKYSQEIYFNTLATAEFRMGNYDQAIEDALKSVEEMKLPTPHPVDSAILTMSHFRVGNQEKAEHYRNGLNEAMKLTKFKDAKDYKSLAVEVNDLLGQKPYAGDADTKD